MEVPDHSTVAFDVLKAAVEYTLSTPGLGAPNLSLEEFVDSLHRTRTDAVKNPAEALQLIPSSAFGGRVAHSSPVLA